MDNVIFLGAVADRRTPTGSVLSDPPPRSLSEHQSFGDLTEVTSLDTSHITSEWDSASTLMPIETEHTPQTMEIQKPNLSIEMSHASSSVRVKEEPRSPKQVDLEAVLEPDTTGVDASLSQLVTSKEEISQQKQREKQVDITKDSRKVKPRFKSYSFSMGENEVRSALLSPVRTQPSLAEHSEDTSEDGSGIMATYVGTLEVDGDIPDSNILKKLAQNLAHMQKTPYVFVTEDELMEDKSCSESESKKAMHTISSQESIPDLFSDAIIKGTEKCADKEDSDLEKSTSPPITKKNTEKCEADGDKESQNVKKKKKQGSSRRLAVPPTVENIRHSPRSKTKSEFVEPFAVKKDKCDETCDKIDSLGSPKKKLSKIYPDPGSPKTRKRKPKKVRDQSSLLLAVGSIMDSSSDSCMVDEDSEESGSNNGKQSRRKKGRKIQKSAAAKLVQEYLHADSSSDVEIDGLEAPGTAARRGRHTKVREQKIDKHKESVMGTTIDTSKTRWVLTLYCQY